jgi:hypothetical protein
MNDYVYLEARRHRGWPWHEESAGKTPMFGEDGWCRSCGVPRRQQCGDLILQRKGLPKATGAWVPNWRFDVTCVERSLADKIAARFEVSLRDVGWPRGGKGDVMQIVAPVVGDAWYDEASLASATAAKHRTIGDRCHECQIWKWSPIPPSDIHGLREEVRVLEHPVIASPEWFGAGYGSFRQVLFKRDLAQYLASASPRDFFILELPE